MLCMNHVGRMSRTVLARVANEANSISSSTHPGLLELRTPSVRRLATAQLRSHKCAKHKILSAHYYALT